MSDVVTAIESPLVALKIEADLNWAGIGEAFARADAGQQAEFLVGMVAGFDRLGVHERHMQYSFIAEAVPSRPIASNVGYELSTLVEFITDRARS